MPYTAYNNVAKMGLAASGGVVKEQYIPLAIYSSSGMGGAYTSTSGTYFLAKGTTGLASNVTSSNVKLHTLNASWTSSQKFAFEASLYVSGTGNTAYAALYDITSSTIVATSQISTTSNNVATLLRSGSFTLTPGHVYGVTIWGANTSNGTYLTKAHLVAIN